MLGRHMNKRKMPCALRLRALEPDRMSPREALDWIYQLQELADKNDANGLAARKFRTV